MKTTLLLLLFLFPTLSFSQYYPDSNSYCPIVVYYDYSLCAKGIKNEEGDILLAPRYSEITLLPGDLLLVVEDEKYGVLNCAFETILPSTYVQLQWVPKHYQKAKHGRDYYWLFATDDGSGMMNSSLEVVIPPIYDDVKRLHSQIISNKHYYNRFNGPYEENNEFYRVQLGSQFGVLNEFGEQILPITYRSIDYLRLHNCPSTRTITSGFYFQVTSDSTQAFYSEQGVQLNEESIKGEMNLISLDSSTIITMKYWEGNSRAICLESGRIIEKKKSDIYLQTFFIFQVFSDRSFRMYNSNLEQIFSEENSLPSTQKTTFFNRTYIHLFSHLTNECTLFSQSGELLVPKTVDNIFVKKGNLDEFIWTIPSNKLTRQADTIRTYFRSGKLKQEIVVDEFERAYFFYQKGTNDHVELFDPFLFIKKGTKWGALDRNGDLKIPFKYDNYGVPFYSEVHLNGKNYETHDGYHVKIDGKTGAIDSLGKQLFECKYDSLVVNFADNLSLIKKGKYYSLVNQRKQYLSKCDDLFNGDFYLLRDEFSDKETSVGSSSHDDKMYYAFGVKNNDLVTLINGKVRVCDSTVLQFNEPLLLVDHVLIDKQGKIVLDIKDGIIRKTKKFYLHLKGNVAQVVQFSGEEGLKIEDFESAQVEADYVKVKLNDQTMGVISLNGENWLYRPKYYDITFTQLPPTHSWVKEDTLFVETYYKQRSLKTYEGRWMLVDTSYTKLYDFPFRIPLNLISHSHSRFESEHHFGIIDSSLNLIFPPKYDYIYELTNSDYVLLYTDSSWQLGHSSGAVLPETFNSIAYQSINKNVAVFTFTENDTLIGILRYDKKFEWLVSMTEMHELVTTSSLNTLLDIESDHFSYCPNLNTSYDSTSHWRILSNELIVNYLLNNQCHIRSLGQTTTRFTPDFEFQDRRDMGIKKPFYDEAVYDYYKVIEVRSEFPKELLKFHKTSYSPNCLTLMFNSPQFLTLLQRRSCNSSRYPRIFKNYLYLDRVEQIELSDILVKNDETSTFLRDFVLRKYTEGQIGGESCPDLEKTETLMWSSFYFIDGGIRFPDLELDLSYDELKPYLTEKGKRLDAW